MKPLEGIRVLDLTRALAGPFCTLMLGDYGADVIKIEIPGAGDDTRHWGPPFVGEESAYFLSINRNKRSLTLNFKDPEAIKIFLQLAKDADVIVENFTPGVMARFGLDYETVKGVNPKIVYCSISGFGQTGPWNYYRGIGSQFEAAVGHASVTGYRIGYDAEGSDGVFYNNRYNAATDPAEDKWLAAETVQIDGEDYCLNEHDARGKVTALTSDAFLADAHVSFSLLPYQVVELTYTVPAGRGGGDETLRGTSGADTLRGTAGGDRIDAGGGNDLVRALGGADEVLAGLGNDRVFAGAGDDTVHGGTGRDRLIGGQGDDTLHGEGGNDRLVGGGGSDTLIGGAGRDRLIGGSGKDTMTGGEGADHFVFKVRDISWGETVTDFTVGVDVLVFQGITNLSADDLKIYRNDAIDGFSIGFSKLDLQGSIHLQGTGDLDWKIVAAATNFEFM